MIGEFFRRLASPAPRPFEVSDPLLALAALLVRVARADGSYSEAERTAIDRVLMARGGLSPFEATQLRTTAEALEAEAPDSVRFTRPLKEAVALEERTPIIEAMWRVAFADGARASDEDSTIRLVCGLLGVSDLDSGLARQRVAASVRPAP